MRFVLRWYEKLAVRFLYHYLRLTDLLRGLGKEKPVPLEEKEDWRDDGGG